VFEKSSLYFKVACFVKNKILFAVYKVPDLN
jgi:hypothetical protein